MRKSEFFTYIKLLILVALTLSLVSLVSCAQSSTDTQTSSYNPPGASAQTQTPTSQTRPTTLQKYETTIPQGIQAVSVVGYPIKVYFSKFPDSLSNFQAVFPVNRTSPSLAVGSYAIQLLIAGPTTNEWQAGYFSELNGILTGPSNCSAPHPVGGPDFTLTLNMKGSHPEQGTATLRFCRTTASSGIGADARITTEITMTLKQFSSIKKVVILTKDAHCFGDLSGKDICLA